MAICKLCLCEKDLIKRSHIIPEFLYKYSGVYDAKHRIRFFSIEELLEGKPPKFPQSGIHESAILCADCDNKLLGANLEYYAKNAIYGGGNLPPKESPDCRNHFNDKGQIFSICSNLDYTKYKLFLLSILWRASISSKDFFKEIELGEDEEILRKMILNNNAKHFNDYPIFVVTTASDKQYTADIIIEPRQLIGADGIKTCCFIIGSFFYIFKIATLTENLDEIREATINDKNQIAILHTQPGTTMELIKNFVGL